jgi:hypothetical protein
VVAVDSRPPHALLQTYRLERENAKEKTGQFTAAIKTEKKAGKEEIKQNRSGKKKRRKAEHTQQ